MGILTPAAHQIEAGKIMLQQLKAPAAQLVHCFPDLIQHSRNRRVQRIADFFPAQNPRRIDIRVPQQRAKPKAGLYIHLFDLCRQVLHCTKADISAPHDEEINHEYQFENPTERKFKREMGDVRASLIIQSNMIQAEVVARQNADNEMSSRITQTSNAITAEVVARQTAIDGLTSTMNSRFTQTANAITAEVSRATTAEGNLSASLSIQASEIAAKVSASGGGGSFSWVLDSSSHTWKSNNTEVMKVSASGLWLKGQIEATSGKIGGFDIGSNALRYNGLNYGDTDKNQGAYIGQSGIQLGKNFRVDNSGNVTANNMSLQGTLTIGGSYISADDLRLGAARANSGYNGWNNAYSWTSNNGSYCTGGANAGYNAYNGLTGTYMQTISLRSGVFKMNDHNVYLGTLYVNGSPYNVLRWI